MKRIELFCERIYRQEIEKGYEKMLLISEPKILREFEKRTPEPKNVRCRTEQMVVRGGFTRWGFNRFKKSS